MAFLLFLLFFPITLLVAILLMKTGMWLVALVIVLDLIIGLRYRSALIFGVAQVLVIGGAYWFAWAAAMEDVGAAIFWVFVAYLWAAAAVAFHLYLAMRRARLEQAGRDG